MTPKVFISYSWTSPGHQATVKQWADRLIADGVDVVLDLYELKEGDDKYVFMEQMVTDASVTHVLMFCDKAYAAKADARQAGVGTESQIISKEVYAKVKQSKFIPIICEVDASGEPFRPAFLQSRIFIDFSTPEAVNENWEQLVRLLYGKPLHQKPARGNPPAFLKDEVAQPSPGTAKFLALKQALLQGKPGVDLYRKDFLDACVQYADDLRIRTQPDLNDFPQRVLADCGKLKVVRDHIIDWVVLEASVAPSGMFTESLLSLLERMRELKARPEELSGWNDNWFEAHSVFVYETFLYIVAALMKAGAFSVLHEIFTTHYLRPKSEIYGDNRFDTFEGFYGHSQHLQLLADPGKKLLSPAAALISRQADRSDTPLASVIEAELLVQLMAFITPTASQWYPQTLLYSSGSDGFPFFARATQHKGFAKLAAITGVNSADRLRELANEGMKRYGVDQWRDFRFHRNGSLAEKMNLAKLDTVK